MATYYHGTHRRHLDSILEQGLRLPPEAEEDEPCPWVWLSHSPNIAADFAGESAGAAVLAINLPPELEQKLVLDLGEYTRCPVPIPPTYITVA